MINKKTLKAKYSESFFSHYNIVAKNLTTELLDNGATTRSRTSQDPVCKSIATKLDKVNMG